MTSIIDITKVGVFVLYFVDNFGTHLRTPTYIRVKHYYGHEYIMNETEFIDCNLNQYINHLLIKNTIT